MSADSESFLVNAMKFFQLVGKVRSGVDPFSGGAIFMRFRFGVCSIIVLLVYGCFLKVSQYVFLR